MLWAAILSLLLGPGFISFNISRLIPWILSIVLSVLVLVYTQKAKQIYKVERILAVLGIIATVVSVIIFARFATFGVESKEDWIKGILQGNLRTACENFYKRTGKYPTSIKELTSEDVRDNQFASLIKDYLPGGELTLKGSYIYDCISQGVGGYTCSATPVQCKAFGLGSKIFTVNRAGIVIEEKCK